jgi:hypothetical protein
MVLGEQLLYCQSLIRCIAGANLLIQRLRSSAPVHIHRMSLISQVQDLFPDLGSGFVLKLLDEYNDDVEQVISHLLEDSLPAHLEKADRDEVL